MSVLNFILFTNLIFDLGYCDHMKRNGYKTNNNLSSFRTDYKARIIGGKESNLEQRRYAVLIMSPKDNGMIGKCGGSIIGAKWVLTASHCYKAGSRGIIKVYPLPISVKWNWITVNKTHRFPRPEGSRKFFDYMLLELVKELTYKTTVHSIDFADSRSEIIPGKYGTVAGWGTTVYGGDSTSRILMEVDLPILTQRECKRISPNLNVNEFCVRHPGLYKNIAKGDSGSGFVVDGKLLGIVIRSSEQYGVVASVPYIRSWICEVTGI